MAERRIGRQTPTQAVVIPYSETKGQEAADIYAETGNELLEWQQLLQCATLLASKGISIAEVSQLLGHSSITTTLNIYTHVFGDSITAGRRISGVIDQLVEDDINKKPPGPKDTGVRSSSL